MPGVSLTQPFNRAAPAEHMHLACSPLRLRTLPSTRDRKVAGRLKGSESFLVPSQYFHLFVRLLFLALIRPGNPADTLSLTLSPLSRGSRHPSVV